MVVRGLGWRLAAVLALPLFLTACGRGEEQDRSPNLLVITLDTLRADHLSCYGYRRETSPILDGLAGTATRFEDVTCSMPTTLPSHLTIFSGLNPSQLGVLQNGVVAERPYLSLFHLLKAQKYETAAVVAAKVLDEPFIAGLGLDRIYFGDGSQPEATQVPGDVVTNRAIEWLARERERPFGLWLHYFDTHEPYAPSPPFDRLFTESYRGELSRALDTQWLVSLNDPAVAGRLTEEDRRHIVDLYDGEIRYLDAQLGRLFETLRRRGLWDDLFLIVIGDHGQAHGEQGFYGHGERLLEPVVKIPLFVKVPRQVEPRVVSRPVAARDLLPTLADWFGWELPGECRGLSFKPALLGNPGPAPPHRVVERRRYEDNPRRLGFAVYREPWKYVFYRDAGQTTHHLGRTDNGANPDLANRFADRRDVAEAMSGLVPMEAVQQKAPEMSEETREMLRSLGYTQ